MDRAGSESAPDAVTRANADAGRARLADRPGRVGLTSRRCAIMAARMRPDIVSTLVLAVVPSLAFPLLAGWLVKVFYQE